MKIVFLIIFIIGICLFGSNFVNECQDLLNYSSHPGFEHLGISKLVYNFIYRGLDISFIPYLSYGVYAMSAYLCIKSNKIGPARQFLLYNLPWLLSPILIHYWFCAYKAGLAISFLASLMFILCTPKTKFRFLTILILSLLSVLSHWSSFILLILIAFDEFKLSNFLMTALKRQKIKKIFLIISIPFLVFIYNASGFTYSGLSTYIEVDSLFLLKDYGRSFPFVAIYTSFIYLCALYSFGKNPLFLSSSEPLNKSSSKIFLNGALALFSTFSLLLSSNAVRFAMPVYFLIFIDLILKLDRLRMKNIYKLSLVAIQSLPFLAYTYFNLRFIQ